MSGGLRSSAAFTLGEDLSCMKLEGLLLKDLTKTQL